MSLTPLLDALSADPVVRKVVETARRGDAPLVDVAVSPGARSPPARRAGRRRRHARCSRSPPPAARPRTSPPRCGCFLPRRPRRRLPVLGDPAARAAQPPQRHRRPAARRAAPAGPPRPRRPGIRPAVGRRRPGPRGAAAAWPRGSATWRPVALQAGDERPLEDVVEALAAAAYTRTDLVERRGEFAVRGGILDVFPPTEEHPRPRRVLGRHGRGDPLVQGRRPAQPRGRRARPLGAAVPRAAAHRRRPRAGRGAGRPAARRRPTCSARSPRASPSRAWSRSPRPSSTAWRRVLDVLPDGADRRARATPSASAPAPTTSSPRAHEFLEASWANAAAGNAVPVDLQAVLGTRVVLDPGRACASTPLRPGVPWWTLTPFAGDAELVIDGDDDVDERFGLETADAEPSAATPTRRSPTCARWVARRLAGRSSSPRAPAWPSASPRCSREHDVAAAGSTPARRPTSSRASSTSRPARSGAGFVAPRQRARGRHRDRPHRSAPGSGTSTKDMRRMPSRRRNQVDPLQLRPGDFVVHEQHGVGRFVEMMQRTVAGATREYLVIEYAPSKRGQPGDRLYVPTDQLDQVTRYVGGEAAHPQQDGRLRLAPRPRRRAKRYVKQIAGRADPPLQRPDGHRRATRSRPDTPWQRELEDAFAYVETPDQLSQHRRGQGRHGAARCRWTGSSAATSATARPRSRCARRSRRSRTASRSRSSCRRRCWSSSTCRPSPSATPQFPVRSCRRCPASRATREAKEVIAGPGRRHGRPRHRHPPPARPRMRGSRTSAWSSSTRSSASASSTRSSSRRCAPRSTCWRCRPRRSRAPSRWRSPASARCPRSQPRPRSATRSSPSSAPTTRSRSPRRSGASCCARARSSSSTTR